MAERKIVTRITLSGENEYKQAVKNVNASLKLYNAELGNLKERNKDTLNSYDYLKQKAEILVKVQATQKAKVDELNKALENAKKAQETYNQKVEDATKKVQAAETECQKLKDTVGENSDEYKQAQAALDQYNSELKEAQSAQELCGQAVTDWKTKLTQAEAQQSKTNTQIEANNRYLEEAKNSADGCATSIDNFGKKTKEAAKKVDSANDSLEKSNDALVGLTNAVISSRIQQSFEAVYQAITQCVEAATNFESSIAKLQTISGASSIGVLSENILSLSSATGIAASDLANTAYNAISAGTAVSDAVSMAESASKLAIAGFTDTDSALSVLTTAINAYGESAGTATEISDSLIQVQNLGVTTVADLAANMGKAIATASAYGVNLSNLEAAYISTTKAGINTAESTTYLSSMFKELGDDGTKVSKIIQEKTGMSFGKLMNSGESLGNVLKMLLDNVNGDTEALMNLWGSAEAAKGANAILTQGITTFNDNLKIVQTSVGATESAYETMADTTEMAGKRAANAFENLKIAVGEQLTPVVSKAQTAFADVTESITDFVKDNPQVVTAIEAVAIGMGVMAGGVVAVNVAVNVLIPLFQSLAATMATNPIGLLVTAATSLVAVFVTLAANAEEADGALKDYGESVDLAKEASDGLKESLSNAESTFTETAGGIAATGEQASDLVERLEALSGKTYKTNDDIDEMSTLVAQLNTLYPELGLEINKATGELNKTNAELERYINNAKNAAMETAYGEKMTEESKAVVEAQEKLTAAKESANKATEEYNALLDEQSAVNEKVKAATEAEQVAHQKYLATLNDTSATIEEQEKAYQDYLQAQNDSSLASQEQAQWNEQYIDTLNQCQEAQEDSTDAIETATEELENAKDVVADTTQAYEDYQFKLTDVGDACQETFDKTIELLDGMDQSSEAYNIVKNSLEDLTNSHVSFQETTQTTYDNLKTQLEELETQHQETTDSILSNLESQVGGLDAVSLETQYSAQEIADNLATQAQYLQNYMDNAQRVMNDNTLQMTDEFKTFLTSGSDEAVQVAAAMNQALQEGNTGAAQAIIDNYTTVQSQLGTTSAAMADAQGDFGTKIADIKSKMVDCVNEMNQEDKAYNNALRTFQGAIRGASGKVTPYKNIFSNASKSAAEALDKNALSYTYGYNNVLGAINGAQSLAGSYVATYAKMADAAIAELKRVDQQNSPSKRYKRHARYNVEGAIQGVNELSGDYIRAYAGMATDAIDAYNAQMEALAPEVAAASEGIFGAVGDISIVNNGKDQTNTLLRGFGASMSSNNKGLSSRLDAVVDLLERYLPDSGTTYLDGDLVSKAISSKVTEKQTATSKLKSVITGVKS